MDTHYSSYEGLFLRSHSHWPETSVREMILNGIPANKIVIGKPTSKDDYNSGANTGYVNPDKLGCW